MPVTPPPVPRVILLLILQLAKFLQHPDLCIPAVGMCRVEKEQILEPERERIQFLTGAKTHFTVSASETPLCWELS